MKGGYVIGIDPAITCGWAVLGWDGVRLASGTWDLSHSRWEGGGMRWIRLRRMLDDLRGIGGGQLLGIGLERLHMRGGQKHSSTGAHEQRGAIVAIVQSWCETQEPPVPYAGMHTAAVKSHATGKGNAGKLEMIDAAARRWKYEVIDDNEADALWIASLMLQEIRGKGAA